MEYMHERNAGTAEPSRLRAMDSSSAAARDCVSRSESLVKHVKTLCFMFCGDDDDDGDIMVSNDGVSGSGEEQLLWRR